MPGFLLQKSPLSPEEVSIMAKRVGIGSNEDSGDAEQPETYYSPFEEPRKDHAILADLVNSPDLERVYASTTAYLRPATDDKPFFNRMKQFSSPRLGFRSVLTAGANGYLPVAEVILAILLIQAVVIAGVMILLPLVRFSRRGLRAPGRWAFLMYFASLGLGFILIEIVLLQRLSLFLGQPIYTFSVVLAGLLIFTGAGSLLAGRFQQVSRRKLSNALLAVVGAVLLTLVATPPILSSALGLALHWRVAVAILVVAPLGIALGVPFSTGLRLVDKEAPPLVPWAWAINGFFTVIGSVGAMILGMAFGFTAVFIIAAACYVAALIAIRWPQHGAWNLLSSWTRSEFSASSSPSRVAS